MNGAELIAEERRRQIAEEGWTPEHDDTHVNGELAEAAAAYATIAVCDDPYYTKHPMQHIRINWPFEWKWWKPGTPVTMLIKAGALIAAEIDRLQLLEADRERRLPKTTPV